MVLIVPITLTFLANSSYRVFATILFFTTSLSLLKPAEVVSNLLNI